MTRIYRASNGIHYKVINKEISWVKCVPDCECSNSVSLTDDYPFSEIFTFKDDIFDGIDFVYGHKLFKWQTVNCHFKSIDDLEKFRIMVTLT